LPPPRKILVPDVPQQPLYETIDDAFAEAPHDAYEVPRVAAQGARGGASNINV